MATDSISNKDSHGLKTLKKQLGSPEFSKYVTILEDKFKSQIILSYQDPITNSWSVDGYSNAVPQKTLKSGHMFLINNTETPKNIIISNLQSNEPTTEFSMFVVDIKGIDKVHFSQLDAASVSDIKNPLSFIVKPGEIFMGGFIALDPVTKTTLNISTSLDITAKDVEPNYRKSTSLDIVQNTTTSHQQSTDTYNFHISIFLIYVIIFLGVIYATSLWFRRGV